MLVQTQPHSDELEEVYGHIEESATITGHHFLVLVIWGGVFIWVGLRVSTVFGDGVRGLVVGIVQGQVSSHFVSFLVTAADFVGA